MSNMENCSFCGRLVELCEIKTGGCSNCLPVNKNEVIKETIKNLKKLVGQE